MKHLAAFVKPEEAHLLRAHLEGHGIAAYVRDDHTVTADWAISNAIGGVKVEVEDEDLAEAQALLAAFAVPRPVPAGPKPHGFDRYLKLFAFVWVVLYGLFVAFGHASGAGVYVTMLAPSLFLAAAVAGIFAVLDR